MIRRTDAPRIPGNSEAAVKLRALLHTYGAARPFLPFYQGDDGSVCALLDGVCVWLPGGDPDEMALFLTMQPDVRAVRTSGEGARRLSKVFGAPAVCGAVMTPARTFDPTSTAGPPAAAATPVVPVPAAPTLIAPTPRAYYPLLRACFGDTLPPFDSWYADVSHRLRHGGCRLLGIEADGRLAAGAMTTAECGPWESDAGAAVIGAVATLPGYRGRGFASRCVTSLAAALQAENREVLLSPKNSPAQALYAKLGFAVCGEWGEIHRDSG